MLESIVGELVQIFLVDDVDPSSEKPLVHAISTRVGDRSGCIVDQIGLITQLC